ncbi:MAG: hypothetical protein WC058_05490 [Phycisphaeraceae bacterium]
MTQATINYASVVIKQRIEVWAENLGFDPDEQILMVLEDKFGPLAFTVADAQHRDECMILSIETKIWKEAKEFALLATGGLAW